MTEPKGLNFGSAPPAAPKRDEPGGLAFPSAPPSAARTEPAGPRGLTFSQAPPAPHTIELTTIGQGVVGHLDSHTGVYTPAPNPDRLLNLARPPQERVFGGDPRAPALVEKARQINAQLAEHRLFRNRLETFLDLRPAMWATWAENDLKILTSSASQQAEFSRKFSLANAVKWAEECEQAYKKPPGLLARIAGAKPEFYQERLTQARDALIEIADRIDTLAHDLRPRLESISVDALVITVATADVTDQSDRITADMRMRTILGGQQTGEMIYAGLEQLGSAIAQQKAIIGDLLAVTIPNWIMARSKA